MLWRRPTKLPTPDELVRLVSPGAAFVDRYAALGQPEGTPPFTFDGHKVVASLAERVARSSCRAHRRVLRRFASLLRGGVPTRFEETIDAVCLLAYDRWRAVHCGEVTDEERPATLAAAAELTIAALALSSQRFAFAAEPATR